MLQNIQNLYVNNHLRSVTPQRHHEYHKISIFRDILETAIEEERAINKTEISVEQAET